MANSAGVRSALVVAWVVVGGLAGCPSDDSTSGSDSSSDASVSVNTSPPQDSATGEVSAPDAAPPDAPQDVEPDLRPDTEPDLPADVPPVDVAADLGPDLAQPDGATDVPVDVEPDLPLDVPLDVPPDVPPDVAPDTAECSVADLSACDDANPCTTASCVAGACVQTFNTDVCDDGDPCTENDACSAGVCGGNDKVCDDNELCTDDSCGAGGACVFTDNTVFCDDGDACTDSDTCSGGQCVGVLKVCTDLDDCTDDSCGPGGVCVFTDNTADCDDDDPCTDNDACSGGDCAGTEKVCDDNEPCTDDSCGADGSCVFADNTVGCNDGDPCTENDACAGGTCGGDDKVCSDDDVCTDDACGADGACVFTDNTADCDDGDPCTENDICATGTCAGADKACDDQNPCTDDSCGADGTCVNAPNTADCDDGDACTLDDVCADGTCGGTDKVCTDDDECTDNVCGADGVCVFPHNTADCNDGDPCTDNDACSAGQCAGVQNTCDDTNPCTDDSCGADGVCVNAPNAADCSDDDPCTEDDACIAGACEGTSKVCVDDDICTDDACGAEGDCVFTHNTADCNDADGCTENDVCNAGTCAGTEKVCNDDDLCTDDGCGADGNCAFTANTADCDDGDPCTVDDVCGAGDCAGADKNCDDQNPCTDDSCDALGNCVNAANTADCDDLDLCTSNDVCGNKVCAGVDKDCGDDDVCTDDVCSGGDCSNPFNTAGCDDGDACTDFDACAEGACAGTDKDCDDQDACTDDSCDGGACLHPFNTAGCDDGDPCTEEDVCAVGSCAGSDKVCDDENECTDDACGPDGICVFTNNFAGCNDGNHCTELDQCSGGQCRGQAKSCSDGQLCTDDECDPATGACVFPFNRVSCDDGQPCTENDACDEGTCAGTQKDCDDSDDCTNQFCNGLGNCIYSNNFADCDDDNACTVNDQCEDGVCSGLGQHCDDNNPCTDNTCAANGDCLFVNHTDPCDDGNACTTEDTCGGGACTGVVAADGARCGDGAACTHQVCVAGTCGVATVDGSQLFLSFDAATPWVDVSGNALTVTPQGGIAYPADGVVGNSATFVGDNEIDALIVETPPGGRFTFAAWVRTAETGDRYFVSRATPASSNGFAMSVNKTLLLNGSSYTGLQLPIGVWTHVAATYDGAEVRLYRNGALETVQAAPHGPLAWEGDLWIGQELDCVNGCTNASQAFAGAVDQVYWLAGPLDADGVATLYEGGSLTCDDADVCTSDACDPAAGCSTTPSTRACDDGLPCTTDTCEDGECVGTREGTRFLYYFNNAVGDFDSADDSSGRGVDLTLPWPGVTPGAAADAPHWSSSGLVFPTTNPTPEAMVVPGYQIPETTFTFATWIKSTGGVGTGIVGRPSNLGANGFVLFTGGVAHLGNTAHVGATPVLPDDTWVHLAASYDGQVFRTYLNGVPYASVVVGDMGLEWTGDLFIGHDVDCNTGCLEATQAFEGVMTEIAWWNRALDPAEVKVFAGGHDLTCFDGATCRGTSICDNASGCNNVEILDACDDDNPCTVDVCEPGVGCVHTPSELPCTEDPQEGVIYAGIYKPGSNDQVRHLGVTWSQLVALQQSEYNDHGRHAVQAEQYLDDAGDLRYDALYQTGPSGSAMWGYASWANFEAKVAELSGSRVLRELQVTYLNNGSFRVLGLWDNSDAQTTEVVHSLTRAEFMAEWETRSASGWRLAEVETYKDAAGAWRFAGAFEERTGAYWLWWGDWGFVSTKLRDTATYRLVDIERFGPEDDPDYFAVWFGSGSDTRFAGYQTAAQFEADRLARKAQGYVLDAVTRHEAPYPDAPPAWATTFRDALIGLTPGYSYAVAKDGEIVGMGGSGDRRATWEGTSPGAPMTAYTRTQLASVSKPITATALMTVVEDQGLDLDAPFYPYLEAQFPVVGTGVEAVTIRQVLQHRGGLNDLGYGAKACRPDLAPVLAGIIGSDVVAAPGTYAYSNTNFCLARFLIEVLTGADYVNYVNASLMIPVGTVDMTAYPDPIDPALYYRLNEAGDDVVEEAGVNFTTDYTDDVGGYGWYASAADLIKWLNGIRLNDYITASLRDEMHSQAMGWFGRTVSNGTAYQHDGAWRVGDGRGVRTGIWHGPGGWSAVLLINTGQASPIGILDDAHEAQQVWP